MKNKIFSLIDYITYMIKYFWDELKLKKIFERILQPILFSGISSLLSFFVLFFYQQIDQGTMLIAIILFSFFLFSYTFRYSFSRKHSRPYWMDVLLPWGIFSTLAYLGYFFIPPKVFNYIFLPLRVFEAPLHLRSWASILVALIFMFLLMTVTRFAGRTIRLQIRSGRH